MIKPYYDDGKGITIYNADCREVLPELGIYDLCLTDPPYGHGDKWQGGTWGAQAMYAEDAQRWDACRHSDKTLALVRRSACKSIIWGGNYYELPPSRCWLAWNKAQNIPTLADFEMAWTNFDAPSKMFSESRNPEGSREHPTQKPLSLFKWCLSFMPEAKSVLDPFCGSGTTLRAAKDLGVKTVVGIELEEKYCEIAANRLRQGVLEL